MTNDSELLLRYLADRSEAAFAELVRRHLDLVYGVALRHGGGNVHLAEDVAQIVFASLARKADRLADRPVLGGWLYRAAQFTTIDLVRAESRRRAREVETQIPPERSTNPEGQMDPEPQAMLLHQAIGELKEADRDAVVLRFFEGRSFAEIGSRLQLTENTARMRVDRALERLRQTLVRRGLTSTAMVLGAMISASAKAKAPAGLAAAVIRGALAHAATGASTATILMSTAKLKSGALIGIGLLACGSAIVWQAHIVLEREHELGEEIVHLKTQVSALRSDRRETAILRQENERLRRPPTGGLAPTSTGPAAPPGAKRRDAWKNLGRVTPIDAYETVMWASDRGDLDLLAQSFILNDAQKARAAAVFGRLPEAEQAKYGSVQMMMALLFSSGTPASFQVISATSPSPNESVVQVQVENNEGRTNILELPFSRDGAGWRVVIPDWEMNKSLAKLE
jgi:RNA polymerase sigma factor (sigma-70 family)